MKQFKIKAGQIVRLIGPVGAATATDMIMVEGRDIGYMYSENSINGTDTGWRFFAGDESDAYINDIDNTDFYDINTIANYDPSIVPCLNEPIGSAWERIAGTNRFSTGGKMLNFSEKTSEPSLCILKTFTKKAN